MNCPRCGARNSESALYCRSCRSPLPRSSRRRAPRGRGALLGTLLAFLVLLALFAGGGYLLGQHALPQLGAPAAASPTPVRVASATPRAVTTRAPATPAATPHRGGARPSPTAGRRRAGRPRATPTSRGHGTATPTPKGTPHPTATPTRGTSEGTAQAPALQAAVLQSNTAWIAAMENASPAGLAAIKTAGSLKAALAEVARLQAQGEHYRIQPGRIEVLWTHLLNTTHAHALVRKTGEQRVLYRTGQATPVATVSDTSTSLYDLVLVGGHWMVARVNNGDLALGEHPDPTPVAAGQAAPSGALTLAVAAAPASPGKTSSSTLPASTPRVYCTAVFPHLAGGDSVSFTWHNRSTGTVLFTYAAAPVGAAIPGTARKWAYLRGPLPAGLYSCEVRLNGAVVGTVPFQMD